MEKTQIKGGPLDGFEHDVTKGCLEFKLGYSQKCIERDQYEWHPGFKNYSIYIKTDKFTSDGKSIFAIKN